MNEKAERERWKRRLVPLVGLAAVVAACLAWYQAESGRHGGAASTQVTLNGIEVFVQLAAGGSRDQFERDATRRTVLLDKEAIARVSTAFGTDAYDLALPQFTADSAAAKRLIALSNGLTQLPDSFPGVDEPMLDALAASDLDAVDPLLAEADEKLEQGAVYGKRSDRATLALTLLAIGVALLGLAGLLGPSRSGRLAIATGGSLLVVATLWGASGSLI